MEMTGAQRAALNPVSPAPPEETEFQKPNFFEMAQTAYDPGLMPLAWINWRLLTAAYETPAAGDLLEIQVPELLNWKPLSSRPTELDLPEKVPSLFAAISNQIRSLPATSKLIPNKQYIVQLRIRNGTEIKRAWERVTSFSFDTSRPRVLSSTTIGGLQADSSLPLNLHLRSESVEVNGFCAFYTPGSTEQDKQPAPRGARAWISLMGIPLADSMTSLDESLRLNDGSYGFVINLNTSDWPNLSQSMAVGRYSSQSLLKLHCANGAQLALEEFEDSLILRNGVDFVAPKIEYEQPRDSTLVLSLKERTPVTINCGRHDPERPDSDLLRAKKIRLYSEGINSLFTIHSSSPSPPTASEESKPSVEIPCEGQWATFEIQLTHKEPKSDGKLLIYGVDAAENTSDPLYFDFKSDLSGSGLVGGSR